MGSSAASWTSPSTSSTPRPGQAKKNYIEFFVPEPKIVLEQLKETMPDKILLMSATFHEEKVLREVFGIHDFGYVEGETKIPGTLRPKMAAPTRINRNTWKKERTRQRYWSSLEQIQIKCAKPALLQVHAFKYLPDNEMKKKLMQPAYQEDQIEKLRNGDLDILTATKTKRGVDFPMCKSVVLLKYPYPDLSSPVLKGMKRKLGDDAFWSYYRDLARREFLQQIGRVLRSKEDEAEFWSPDYTCYQQLNSLRENFNNSLG